MICFLEFKLYCWGSWDEADFKFVMLSQANEHPQYVLVSINMKHHQLMNKNTLYFQYCGKILFLQSSPMFYGTSLEVVGIYKTDKENHFPKKVRDT